MKAIYTSYHWVLVFICSTDTPQAELQRNSIAFAIK